METPHGRSVRDPIARGHLTAIAVGQFGDMVKAVVDVSRRLMAFGGEMHADAGWIEFDAMINVRPAAGNRVLRMRRSDTSSASPYSRIEREPSLPRSA